MTGIIKQFKSKSFEFNINFSFPEKYNIIEIIRTIKPIIAKI
jgi:hypothetical protein